MKPKSYFTLLFVILFASGTYSQEKIFIHPENDPHWKAVIYENFDSTFDQGIWQDRPPWGPTNQAATCDYINYPGGIVTNNDVYAATTRWFQNVSADTGVLNIQTRREQHVGEVWKYNPFRVETDTFNYTTGLLWSDSLYKYGYYEISIKLPEAPQNNLDLYSGLGPNFWLWSAENYPDGSMMRYSEIDIFEIQSHNPYDFDGKPNNRYTRNFHFLCDTLPGCPTDSFFHAFLYSDDINVNFSNFQTFAAYWSEETISYFHSDTIVNTTDEFLLLDFENLATNSSNRVSAEFNHSNKFYPMYLIIDNYVPGRQFCISQTDSTQMPYDYLIDHIKVWQLKNACDSDLVVADIHPTTYDYTVKQNIELGDGGGTLSNGEDLILRANQSITIEAGYEALAGSELTLVISDCMPGAGVFHPQQNPGGLMIVQDSASNTNSARPILYPIE